MDHSSSDGVLLMPTSTVDPEKQHGNKRCDEEEDKQFWGHWPTVLSVEPLVHCHSSVCRLSSVVVCDVLYCGETVRFSEKLSEGVNRKPGSKS